MNETHSMKKCHKVRCFYKIPMDCDCETRLDDDETFLDYSQQNAKTEKVQTSRIGAPALSPDNKFVTRSVWLGNNRLKSIKHLDAFIATILEEPLNLAWLDLSFNKIQELDQSILTFPLLRIIYLHGNNISDVKEVMKLKPLKSLKTLTLHGNPVYGKKNYRNYIITQLPQVVNLDFATVTNGERTTANKFEQRVE